MLSVVATPIGNLDDLSVRQAHTIMEADIVLTENTHTTGILLPRITTMFGISRNPQQKIIPHAKEQEFRQLPTILSYLNDDYAIALISESGTPLISDPGALLIQTCIKRAIPFTVIPGSTAYTTALVHAGIKTQNALFVGFIPKKQSERMKMFTKLRNIQSHMDEYYAVGYDSAQRINQTLADIHTTLPHVYITVCQELTKMFETIHRGSPQELQAKGYKGELTLVIHLKPTYDNPR